jgi:hypothetical protein
MRVFASNNKMTSQRNAPCGNCYFNRGSALSSSKGHTPGQRKDSPL